MQVLAALLAGFVAGSGVAYVAAARFAAVRRSTTGAAGGAGSGRADPAVLPVPRPRASPAPGVGGRPVPSGVARRVLEVARSGAVVLDGADEVVLANPAARRTGVLRAGLLVVDDIARLARAARACGEPLDAVVDLPLGRLGREPTAVSVHAAPLDAAGHVAVLLDDVTEARRLEAVRRDFVANVSHELKTPVGALTLLAEAVQDAADDPDAVRRFAGRMQHEGTRLGRLVQELVELSRLQGADPLPEPRPVAVDDVVAEAVDRTALAADTAGITVVTAGERGLVVRGEEAQLVTALVNLVDNAVAYSPSGTRVAVGVRLWNRDTGRGSYVEISVSDQGIGIAEQDQQRVFERFYRADPARSRATGGTGLGLAIVKHIVSNHGGQVRVWSVLGSGSTFTLRLPAADPEPPAADVPADRAPHAAAVHQRPTARTAGG